jgi:hypothetical protein
VANLLQQLADVHNWHRFLLAFLGAILVVATAILSGTVTVPPGLVTIIPYVGIVVAFLTAFLPRWQLPTGAGAAAILSPPAKADPLLPQVSRLSAVDVAPPIELRDVHEDPVLPPKAS